MGLYGETFLRNVPHPHPNPPLEGEGTQYQPPLKGREQKQDRDALKRQGLRRVDESKRQTKSPYCACSCAMAASPAVSVRKMRGPM